MFDLRTEIRSKEGRIVQRQYYVRHVSAEFGEYFEREGKFFSPAGNEISNPKAAATAEVEAPKGAKPAKAGTVETLTTKQ